MFPKILDNEEHQQIRREAYADDRFVMYLFVRWSPAPICFAPKYFEADVFLKNYAFPFRIGARGSLNRTSWRTSPTGEASAEHWSEYVRWEDVYALQFHTETPEQYTDLNMQLTALIDAWNAKPPGAGHLAEIVPERAEGARLMPHGTEA